MPTVAVDTWSCLDRSGATVQLQTLAVNLESWGDSRQSVPPVRGKNVVIPHLPGEQYTPKMPDSRVITLAGWVRGVNDDGSAETNGPEIGFRQNWAQLKSLLFNRGEQFTLTKQFYDGAGTLRTASALVECAGGLQPSMIGRNGARFTVDLLMADPFFYSTPQTFACSTATPYTGAILGDWYATRVSYAGNILTQPCDNFGFTIGGLPLASTWTCTYVSTLTGAIAIDGPSQTMLLTGLFKLDSYVKHTGFGGWLWLPPGATSSIVAVAAHGTFSGNFTYSPAWY